MTEIVPKIRVLIVCLCSAVALLASQASAQNDDCGGYSRPIILAGLDWDSVQVHNAIASHILEEGFGCRTDSIPGSTVPMQQGVVRGDIDVAMEVWTDNLPEFMPAALESGQVIDLGINFADANQGWFVPRYMIEGDPERGIEAVAPDLRSVADLERYAGLFRDPEQPNKGRFYNCIIGWVCEEINTEKLEAYGLDDDFSNFRPGTGVALATSMESAYLRGEPWFGYYWGPTWVLGKLDMYQLQEPEYSEACWERLSDTSTPSGEGCAYPASTVIVVVNGEFAAEIDSAIIDFLRDYETSNEMVSGLLAYMEENDETLEGAARHFLETRADVWSEWVPADVQERVAASLR
jgi:glycine betaine/proline transport system substrate-binding protein